MSFAIHLLVTEKFSKDSFREFLGKVQSLYGTWDLEESVPFNEDQHCLTIHESWVKSGEVSSNDWFRINIAATRRLKEVFMWNFDYEWHLRFETSAGRSPIGLAVQLGAWLVAMHGFRFNVGIDRDSSLENEATEFRSIDAGVEHTRRLITQKPPAWSADLKERGIVNEEGYLLLPQDISKLR
jgi:hypothetical protein